MAGLAEIGSVAFQTVGDRRRIGDEIAAQSEDIRFARVALRQSSLLGVGSGGSEHKQADDGAG